MNQIYLSLFYLQHILCRDKAVDKTEWQSLVEKPRGEIREVDDSDESSTEAEDYLVTN